jgi:hypothetical protein
MRKRMTTPTLVVVLNGKGLEPLGPLEKEMVSFLIFQEGENGNAQGCMDRSAAMTLMVPSYMKAYPIYMQHHVIGVFHTHASQPMVGQGGHFTWLGPTSESLEVYICIFCYQINKYIYNKRGETQEQK